MDALEVDMMAAASSRRCTHLLIRQTLRLLFVILYVHGGRAKHTPICCAAFLKGRVVLEARANCHVIFLLQVDFLILPTTSFAALLLCL